MHGVPRSVLIVTALLLFNAGLAGAGGPHWLVAVIALAGPFLVLWMVVDVLKDTSVSVRELDEDEHWGYQDRPDLRPGR
jgi:hypothetical protein